MGIDYDARLAVGYRIGVRDLEGILFPDGIPPEVMEEGVDGLEDVLSSWLMRNNVRNARYWIGVADDTQWPADDLIDRDLADAYLPDIIVGLSDLSLPADLAEPVGSRQVSARMSVGPDHGLAWLAGQLPALLVLGDRLRELGLTVTEPVVAIDYMVG